MASRPEPRELRLALGLPAWALALFGAAHEVGVRQTDAYLGPGLDLPRAAALGVFLGAGGAGAFLGARGVSRVEHRTLLLARLGAGLSLVLSLSGPLWFQAFQRPQWLGVAALGLTSAAGGLAGAALGALFAGAGLAYRELGSIRWLLSPMTLLGALLLGLGAAVGLSHAGLWRSGALFGLVLGLLTLLLGELSPYFADLTAPPRGLPRTALAAGVLSLLSAQAFVPAGVVASYPADVVWASGGKGELVVASGQNTFQLFEAEQLRLTSADDYRTAELAVHPALLTASAAERVLVLGPAGGFLEREVLRHARVREVVSVSEQDDSQFRGSLWPTRALGSSEDSRLRRVVAEPLPWLSRHAERFDCILMALPAPASYLQGKYYTHYFFRLLREHLSPAGVLLVQAASRATLPQTYENIRRTLDEPGFVQESYEAPLPLLGALSFVLVSRSRAPARADELPSGLRFLDREGLARSLALAEAPGPPSAASAHQSTLDAQHAVSAWLHEQAALGNR